MNFDQFWSEAHFARADSKKILTAITNFHRIFDTWTDQYERISEFRAPTWPRGSIWVGDMLFWSSFDGVWIFRAKISIFFEKNHIFRFFSIFLRRGSSRMSIKLLNESKIRVWGLSSYCGTQLHGSQGTLSMPKNDFDFCKNQRSGAPIPMSSIRVNRLHPAGISHYLISQNAKLHPTYHFRRLPALTLQYFYAFSKVWIFQILNKINLGSSVVVSRSKRTDFW